MAATYSGGERRRIALGRAIVRDPRIFLLPRREWNLAQHTHRAGTVWSVSIDPAPKS
jgi:ABC-type sugar transport system ATPase subunit